ncbi:class I SAM-dependent methyltransferase [bacterium]|nr:class I SAM-dependent methyltransferase [bacterium]
MIEPKYLSGDFLYGDDFSEDQIKQWYEKEKTGYENLNEKTEAFEYGYHELNRQLGFNKLPKDFIPKNTLGFGSFDGSELSPIQSLIEKAIIIDPTEKFTPKLSVPTQKLAPSITGEIPCDNDSVDLITCLGVLHHIPNVTHVFDELIRVLKPGGYCIVREPIISMGDWTQKRPGLTPCERGLSKKFFKQLLSRQNLKIIAETPCVFPLISRAFGDPEKEDDRGACYNKKFAVVLDTLISKMLKWNYIYHISSKLSNPFTFWRRLRPICNYYVIQKV